jgi:ribonuclease P protein component
MLGRILRSADFNRALSTPARARSAHFAAHHVPIAPTRAKSIAPRPETDKLSTVNPDRCAQAVDELALGGPDRCWLGVTVPKRHAREAATRNLIKRQIRAAMRQHAPRLARGLWLVRLRLPFDRQRFISATSGRLRHAARLELDDLLQRAAR